ncbi:MAG: hypothetical protein K2K06_08155 [Oscillospiraceae bacterium]|nr:hypothetical protein [Ruminococcus sp.]MDE6707991.1 hypothetical protein [Oscillospiraceae bacterium]
MHKLLEILYFNWCQTTKKDTPEYLKICDTLDENTFRSVFDCIAEENKIAFQAGFQTAVQLLLSRDK